MDIFNFFLPTRIVFGPGSIGELNKMIDEKYEKVLLVTDNYLNTNTDIIRIVKDTMTLLDVYIFDEIEENPSYESIEKGSLMARDIGADMVLGVGGGSSMDAAKGIAIGARNVDSLKSIVKNGAALKDPLPVYCIPTTSGTGSEITPFAVFSDLDQKTKDGYGHDKIFPELSIIDPELSYSVPSEIVINTGLDVLAHSVEAYLSLESSEMSDIFALRAIELCLANLEKAVEKNSSAQINMSYASMLAGIAITHASTILPHIMGYPLTVYHKIPHGRASALLLPSFLLFMKENNLFTNKIDKLKVLFGSYGSIDGFFKSLGIETSLSYYGVLSNEIPVFVKKTIVKGDVKITPGNINEEIIQRIYEKAL